MHFSQGRYYVISGLLVSAFLLFNCKKDVIIEPNKVPHLFMDFERSTEPFQIMPERPADSLARSNGCLPGIAWNQYYKFNVCIATTCEISDFAIERSDKYARDGISSLRFFLKPTPFDKWPLGEASHRAELSPSSTSPFKRYPVQNEERWYGMSILFPEDFVFAPEHLESDLRFSIAQWQHGTEGSPIFALEVYGDKIAVARSKGESHSPVWIPPEFITEIKKGTWIDLVAQVKWHKEEGTVNVWVNGEHQYENSGIQTIYENLTVGGGFKIGLYYWRWQSRESVSNTFDSGIFHREIFIDEVREYLGGDGATAVTPGNKF